MKPLPLLLLLLTALPTFARLGETRAECETRYGKPVGATLRNGNPIYHKGGYQIIIGFFNDKATFLYLTKLKPGTKDTDLPVGLLDSVELSEAEINVLLQANSGTFKWKQRDTQDADPAWDLSDGKCEAQYADRSLDIRNKPAFDEHIKERNLKRAAGIPHLGESKAELEKRCGKPVKTITPDELNYQKGSFKIAATFSNDKAVVLSFESVEPYSGPSSGDPGPDGLYRDEIKALLTANEGNSKWVNSATDEDYWNRADKKAHAIYDMSDFVFSIIDNEYADQDSAKRDKEAAAKFSTFGGLGKTKAECEKLYGKPLRAPADGPYAYHKNGIAIIITYWNDKAAKFDFIKLDAKAPTIDEDRREPFYHVEHTAILKSFGAGTEWAESDDNGDELLSWLRKDSKAVAQYDGDEKTFTIYAYEYFLHISKELKDDDDTKPSDDTKSLDGF